MRRIKESAAIVGQIVGATGLETDRVEHLVSALRDAIDGLFLDGYTIFAPPFSLTYPSDPVAPVFAERIQLASHAEIEAWHLCDMEATAKWLDIPTEMYMRHPIASDLRVLVDFLDALEIEDADSPAGIDAGAAAEAWFDTFHEERPYRLGNVGFERDLEAWLIHHTERLVQIGYDVQLRQQQFVLPDRRRPDLVFDLTEDDGSMGTLIVELKATSGYLGAVDQLAGYMDSFASLGLANGALRGLLVADGIPPDVLAYADEKGIDTATLTELGYRRDLASATTTNPLSFIADSEPETIVQTFLIHAVPSQNGSATPVMYVDADSIDAVPTAVRPFDPDDEHHTQLASGLWESIVRDSEFNTVGHIAVSYGGVTHSDGSPVDPPPNAAEETAIIDADSLDVAVPAYFLAWGQSVYQAADSESAPDPEPFLRLTVRSLSHSVSDVEPVGAPGWEYESAMEQMASDVLTAEQLSAYFGSSCHLLPANAAAEQEQAAWEVTREQRKANAVRARRRVNPRTTDDPAPAPWEAP